MSKAPVLFFHCVDEDNLNAQSINTKNILARWDAADLPASVFHFNRPDPSVVANPNVRLLKLPTNRFWKEAALSAALRRYSGVIYPGLAPVFDNRVRKMRKMLGRSGITISTLEGLPADEESISSREAKLSEIAGHSVHCQPVASNIMAGIDSMKSEVDLIIAISPFLQRMSKSLWPEQQAINVPLGVNSKIFHADGRRPHNTNQRLQVVSAGSFQPRKRPNVFLELAKRHPEADFAWYGNGPMRGLLIDQIHKERVQNIEFPGPRSPEKLSQAFKEADLFVLPSISEGVPKVIQEAAACGLPIVCMNYYEPFSVQHGVNGFLAEDDASLFRHVSSLIHNREARAAMGSASAEMARAWNWDNLSQYWQSEIRSAVLGRNSEKLA